MTKHARIIFALVVLLLTLPLVVVEVVHAANSVARSKQIIQNIQRHDATLPSNAQLSEIGLAFLYHPRSGPIITQYLTQQGLVLNPADETVLEDIGTLAGEVFTPAGAATINQYLASVHRRHLRKYHKDVYRAWKLLTANAPALPIQEARASVIATADADSAAIVGDDTDDPEN